MSKTFVGKPFKAETFTWMLPLFIKTCRELLCLGVAGWSQAMILLFRLELLSFLEEYGKDKCSVSRFNGMLSWKCACMHMFIVYVPFDTKFLTYRYFIEFCNYLTSRDMLYTYNRVINDVIIYITAKIVRMAD